MYDALSDSANLELRLGRELALGGLWPALDPSRSKSRSEEAILSPEELDGLLKLYQKVSKKTLRISKTFGIEGRKLLTPEDNYEAFRDFTGRVMQAPPPFSAKRVGGVRAYKLARERKPVELAPVEVEVYALEVIDTEGDLARFAVECSGGTYVRSLAHDIGRKVGCPAHLASLRRTAVAEFKENQAVTLVGLRQIIEEGKLEAVLVPLEALLPDCPALVVRGREEQGVRHGHKFELAQSLWPDRGSRADHMPVITLLKILNPADFTDANAFVDPGAIVAARTSVECDNSSLRCSSQLSALVLSCGQTLLVLTAVS